MKTDPKWMFKIRDVKDLIPEIDGEEEAEIINIINVLIPQLKQILENFPYTIFNEDDSNSIKEELTSIIDNFNHILYLSINQDEWDDFDFDGDFCDIFNEYLAQLYDLADMKPIDKNSVRRKLIWVG